MLLLYAITDGITEVITVVIIFIINDGITDVITDGIY